MASTASTSATPLNFSDVPTEIYQKILLKHFETGRAITFWNPEVFVVTNFTIKHKFGPQARIALTSKRFLEETVQALKTSPYTTLIFDSSISEYQAAFAYRDEHIQAFAKHTRIIHTKHSFLYQYPSPYIRLAPKLTTLHVKCGNGTWASSERFQLIGLGNVLGRQYLRQLVRGDEDAYIATKISGFFTSSHLKA